MNRALSVLLLIVSLLQFVTGEQALARPACDAAAGRGDARRLNPRTPLLPPTTRRKLGAEGHDVLTAAAGRLSCAGLTLTGGAVTQEGLRARVQNSAPPQQKDEKTEQGPLAQPSPTPPPTLRPLPPVPRLSYIYQSAEQRPLSLTDAIRLTLTNNKEVELGRTGVRNAEIELNKVKKSARGDAGRRAVEIAQRNLEAADAKFRQITVEAIADVQYAYWSLVLALRDQQTKLASFVQAREVLRLTQAYFTRGELDRQDVTLVDIELSNREQAIYDTKDAIVQAENALKFLMAVDKDDAMWNATLTPTDPDDYITEAEPSLTDTLNAALQNRPDLMLQRIAEKINEINQQYYKRQDEKGANYQQSLLEGERLKTERQRLGLRVQVDVRNALQRLNSARMRLLSARQGRMSLEEILAAEQRKFITGETSTRELLTSQFVLANAQLLELRASNDYAKALSQVTRVTGANLQPAGR